MVNPMRSIIEFLFIPLVALYLYGLFVIVITPIESLNIAFLQERSLIHGALGVALGIVMVFVLGYIAILLSSLTIDILRYITGNKKDEPMFHLTYEWWLLTKPKVEKKKVVNKPKEEEKVNKKSDPKETFLAFIAVAMLGGFIYWLYAGLYG